MGTYADVTALNGLFKEKYADSVISLIPAAAKVQRLVPFSSAAKLGNYYHQPVALAYESGFTHASGSNAGTAFTLNGSNSQTMKDAQIQGSEIVLQTAIPFGVFTRAADSERAVVEAMKHVISQMLKAASKRLEIELIYGSSNIGTPASRTNVNGTTTSWVITAANWSAGIWAGSEGTKLDLYQSNGTTKINTNAALVVSIVDVANRKITVTGNSSDITSIDSYVNSNPDVAQIYFYGAQGNEMSGLNKILTNTGSLFNIDASAYALWKSTSYAVGSAALTFGKIQDAAAQAANLGLADSATVLVSPRTWGNLMIDQAALRKYDSKYSTDEAQNGFQAMTFYGQTGEIKVVPHIFIKEGESFLFPTDNVIRVGSTDWTFKRPTGEDFFTNLPTAAGVELRMYTDQAILCQTPAQAVKLTGIVNS